MLQHTPRKALGPQRRWVFRVWVGLTIALAVYLLIAIPFADLFTDRFHFIVAAVPFVMTLLALIGVGWLVWIVTARRSGGPGERIMNGGPEDIGSTNSRHDR